MIGKFWELLKAEHEAPRLLECGTKRWGREPVGMKAEFLSHFPRGAHVGTDCEAGEDVDLVADLHELGRAVAVPYDAALCCSVLEHCRRPWVCARQLALATFEGALLYVQSHQVFPLHFYSGDYFRFSKDALCELFCPQAGWEVIECGYEFPCRVLPLENSFPHSKDWNFEAPGFLVSWCLCRRVLCDPSSSMVC